MLQRHRRNSETAWTVERLEIRDHDPVKLRHKTFYLCSFLYSGHEVRKAITNARHVPLADKHGQRWNILPCTSYFGKICRSWDLLHGPQLIQTHASIRMVVREHHRIQPRNSKAAIPPQHSLAVCLPDID